MHLFQRNNVIVILVKVLHNATFSGIRLTQPFLHERLHCEVVFKNRFNISSGSYGAHVQVIKPFLLISSYKPHLIASFTS